MIFTTNRLYIKRLSPIDSNDFHMIHSDKELMNMIPAPTLTVVQSNSKLTSIIDAYEIKEHYLRVWGAYSKEDDRLIGICAAIRESKDCCDIGYRILKKYWNQGFASELTLGLITYLKSNSSIKKLSATVDVNNIASIKVLEKYMRFTEERYDVSTQSYERFYQLVLTD